MSSLLLQSYIKRPLGQFITISFKSLFTDIYLKNCFDDSGETRRKKFCKIYSDKSTSEKSHSTKNTNFYLTYRSAMDLVFAQVIRRNLLCSYNTGIYL